MFFIIIRHKDIKSYKQKQYIYNILNSNSIYIKQLFKKMKTKYQKENLIEIINKSKNLTEVLRYLNMTVLGNSRNTIRKYIKLHDIDISHFETTKERYDRISQKNGKLRLIPVENQLFSGSTISTNFER